MFTIKKTASLLLTAMLALASFSCSSGEVKPEEKPEAIEEQDSMIYGLSCDGTNDSVIVFLPFKEGVDPITYNIEMARAAGRVFGKPQIGDWVGIIINPQDTTELTMVVNLDKLKGTWTHEVRPTWKDASKMTARAMRRNFAEMPDSLKEAYFIPREYGFTLKRSSMASPVGMIRSKSSLEDDSPVEYPKVKYYTNWKTRNGHLILTSTDKPRMAQMSENDEGKKAEQHKETYDTLDFVFMDEDSLVMLTQKKEIISFHRKENARAANAAAQKAAQKVQQKKLQ